MTIYTFLNETQAFLFEEVCEKNVLQGAPINMGIPHRVSLGVSWKPYNASRAETPYSGQIIVV